MAARIADHAPAPAPAVLPSFNGLMLLAWTVIKGAH
jgi:hypothetical protein